MNMPHGVPWEIRKGLHFIPNRIMGKENTMTEYKRVREQVRHKIDDLIVQEYHLVHQVDKDTELADQILSLNGIEIRADVQSLPSVRNAVNKSYNDYMLGQEDMLKAGFIKIAPKEG